MRYIPPALLAEILEDPWFAVCCVSGKTRQQEKIELHHNFIFASKQVNAKKFILPLSKSVHDRANNKEMKERLDWIMLSRMTEEEIKEISKAVDYGQRFKYLKGKYGIYRQAV